tara:strand:+ start:14107 stop:14358 length:252 start_codon:yes stop_codon:yes gene_type:complete
METSIRERTLITLINYCKNERKAGDLEKGIYNHTIFSANKNSMNINWDDSNFTDIYYKKLAATLELILSVKNLESEGICLSNN